MSVAVPAHNAAGQEALVYATVTDKPDLPKVPQADASGKQRDQRDQERQAPKDHVSERLQSMARLAERRAAKEAAYTSSTSQASSQQASAEASRQAAERAAARQVAARKSHSSSLQALQTDATRQSAPQPQPQADKGVLHAGSMPYPKPPVAEQAKARTSESQDSSAQSAFAAAAEAVAARRARQPGPAELASLPDAVARYDSNGDGRIDQGEMKQVYRAKDERSSYAGLAQPRHPSADADPLYEEATGDEPKKLFSDQADLPVPGQYVSEDAPPLPGTEEAAPLYALPGERGTTEQDVTLLTPQERRALAEAQDPTLDSGGEDAPPLYVPPEDRVVVEEVTITADELAVEEELLQPRKLFGLAEEVDQAEAAQTYRQVGEGYGGRSSIIA